MEYREKFPNGIKFPKTQLIADTESTRLFRPDGKNFETLSCLIEREMSEISAELKKLRQTEMYTFDYNRDDQDIFLDNMRRVIAK